MSKFECPTTNIQQVIGTEIKSVTTIHGLSYSRITVLIKYLINNLTNLQCLNMFIRLMKEITTGEFTLNSYWSEHPTNQLTAG